MLPLLRTIATVAVIVVGWSSGVVFGPLGFALVGCIIVVIWRPRRP